MYIIPITTRGNFEDKHNYEVYTFQNHTLLVYLTTTVLADILQLQYLHDILQNSKTFLQLQYLQTSYILQYIADILQFYSTCRHLTTTVLADILQTTVFADILQLQYII